MLPPIKCHRIIFNNIILIIINNINNNLIDTNNINNNLIDINNINNN